MIHPLEPLKVAFMYVSQRSKSWRAPFYHTITYWLLYYLSRWVLHNCLHIAIRACIEVHIPSYEPQPSLKRQLDSHTTLSRLVLIISTSDKYFEQLSLPHWKLGDQPREITRSLKLAQGNHQQREPANIWTTFYFILDIKPMLLKQYPLLRLLFNCTLVKSDEHSCLYLLFIPAI